MLIKIKMLRKLNAWAHMAIDTGIFVVCVNIENKTYNNT